jgi:hypothetical protein
MLDHGIPRDPKFQLWRRSSIDLEEKPTGVIAMMPILWNKKSLMFCLA